MPAARSSSAIEKLKRSRKLEVLGCNGNPGSTQIVTTSGKTQTSLANTETYSQGREDIEEALKDWAEIGERDVKIPTGASRLAYKSASGKRVTPHHWAVYDLVKTIPCGKVTTYKHICDKLGAGSPRSVGSALRNNPFAPTIPCHRVISSDLSLGGFMGEWGTESVKGSRCSRKLEMLTQEGVPFTAEGKLARKEDVWKWN